MVSRQELKGVRKTWTRPPQHFRNTCYSTSAGYFYPHSIMKWSLPPCDISRSSLLSVKDFTSLSGEGHCWRKPADPEQYSLLSFLLGNAFFTPLTFACISTLNKNRSNWTRKDDQHSSHVFMQARRWLKKVTLRNYCSWAKMISITEHLIQYNLGKQHPSWVVWKNKQIPNKKAELWSVWFWYAMLFIILRVIV